MNPVTVDAFRISEEKPLEVKLEEFNKHQRILEFPLEKPFIRHLYVRNLKDEDQFDIAKKSLPITIDRDPKSKKSARKYLWSAQDGICRYCDLPMKNINEATLDHIVPFSRGGVGHISNLCLVHGQCNVLKGNICSFEEAADRAAKMATDGFKKQQEGLKLLVFFKKLKDKGILK